MNDRNARITETLRNSRETMEKARAAGMAAPQGLPGMDGLMGLIQSLGQQPGIAGLLGQIGQAGRPAQSTAAESIVGVLAACVDTISSELKKRSAEADLWRERFEDLSDGSRAAEINEMKMRDAGRDLYRFMWEHPDAHEIARDRLAGIFEIETKTRPSRTNGKDENGQDHYEDASVSSD